MRVVAIIIIVLVVLLGILILIIVLIRNHGGKLPGFLNNLSGKITKRIENKEQIFYDDTNYEEK